MLLGLQFVLSLRGEWGSESSCRPGAFSHDHTGANTGGRAEGGRGPEDDAEELEEGGGLREHHHAEHEREEERRARQHCESIERVRATCSTALPPHPHQHSTALHARHEAPLRAAAGMRPLSILHARHEAPLHAAAGMRPLSILHARHEAPLHEALAT
jgi:hypothetical protein